MSPCGTLLTVASGHDVLFFSLESNTLVHSHKLKLPVKCAALHPSRSHFAVGLEEDLWVRLYDFKTGAEFDCQRGHHGPVNCVAFVPGSNTYATGSVDGTIRLWTPLNDETLPPLAL
jgi:serine-threonine kinase receptor-associated protein